MVDDVRLARLLRAVSDDRSVLDAESTADHRRRQDPLWLRGVKYSFVTMIEACVDIAQHICSSEGWGPPANNADAMRVLAEHGVLPVEVAEQMRRPSASATCWCTSTYRWTTASSPPGSAI